MEKANQKVLFTDQRYNNPNRKEDTYTGITGRSSKERLYEHNTDMRHKPNRMENKMEATQQN